MQTGSGSEMSLKAACCACLTELVVNDANGQQTVQNNGIFLLAMLLVQPMSRHQHITTTTTTITAAAADTPDAVTAHLQVGLHNASSSSQLHCIDTFTYCYMSLLVLCCYLLMYIYFCFFLFLYCLFLAK